MLDKWVKILDQTTFNHIPLEYARHVVLFFEDGFQILFDTGIECREYLNQNQKALSEHGEITHITYDMDVRKLRKVVLKKSKELFDQSFV